MAAVAAPWDHPQSWPSSDSQLQEQDPVAAAGNPHRDRPKDLAQALLKSTEDVLRSPKESKAEAHAQTRELLNCALERLDEEGVAAHWDLIACLLELDAPIKLLSCMQALDFEDKKAATRLLDTLVRRPMMDGAEAAPLVESYVHHHPTLIKQLLSGCGNPKVFFLCTQLVKSCALSSMLAKALLDADAALHLLGLASSANFDISSEAFSSLRELLLVHPALSTAYVEEHLEQFFPEFHKLLRSQDNYVIQRQAVRLLAELLLDGHFQGVMGDYVKSEQFLMIHMNLLIDKSLTICLEAFHIFKLFAANPRKPLRVLSILTKNRDGLIKRIRSFSGLQKDDESFENDVMLVVQMLSDLEA